MNDSIIQSQGGIRTEKEYKASSTAKNYSMEALQRFTEKMNLPFPWKVTIFTLRETKNMRHTEGEEIVSEYCGIHFHPKKSY